MPKPGMGTEQQLRRGLRGVVGRCGYVVWGLLSQILKVAEHSGGLWPVGVSPDVNDLQPQKGVPVGTDISFIQKSAALPASPTRPA